MYIIKEFELFKKKITNIIITIITNTPNKKNNYTIMFTMRKGNISLLHTKDKKQYSKL